MRQSEPSKMGIVRATPSPKSSRGPSSVPKRTGHTGSPCTWRALSKSQTWSASCALGKPWVQKGVREQNGILFRRNSEFVVERVMQDFLHVVPICDDDERLRQTRRKGAQYLHPALGWRLRNHHGGLVRPRRSSARARSEVNTLAKRSQHTFEQKHLS